MTINPNYPRGDVTALPGLPLLARALAAEANEPSAGAGSGGPAPTIFAASIGDVLDELLEQLQRRRQRAVAEVQGHHRAARVAELYEQEARLWSLLFERSERRIHWRDALSAEAYARSCARAWRTRAHGHRSCTCTHGNAGLNGAWSR